MGCATVLSVLFFLQVTIIESDKQTAKNTKRIKIDRPQTRLSVVNVESSSIHKANYLHIQMLRYLNPINIAIMIHFTAFHVQYKLQLLSKTCGTPRDGNLPTLHFVFEVSCILARFRFENLSALNFVFLYFGCLMTRNDYFLDWIFESFQSLLVPCVGLSII